MLRCVCGRVGCVAVVRGRLRKICVARQLVLGHTSELFRELRRMSIGLNPGMPGSFR